MNFFVLTLALFSAYGGKAAHGAGGMTSGGGGNAVVCETVKGATVESFDLWEHRKLNRRSKLPAQDVPLKDTLEKAIFTLAVRQAPHNDEFYFQSLLSQRSLPASMEGKIRSLYERLQQRIENPEDPRDKFKGDLGNFSDDATVAPVQDNGNVVEPSGNCRRVQLAYYRDRDPDNSGKETLYLNFELFKKMLPLDQAALILHEVVYRYLREFGQVDSAQTRRLVANILSGNELLGHMRFERQPHHLCMSENYWRLGMRELDAQAMPYQRKVGRNWVSDHDRPREVRIDLLDQEVSREEGYIFRMAHSGLGFEVFNGVPDFTRRTAVIDSSSFGQRADGLPDLYSTNEYLRPTLYDAITATIAGLDAVKKTFNEAGISERSTTCLNAIDVSEKLTTEEMYSYELNYDQKLRIRFNGKYSEPGKLALLLKREGSSKEVKVYCATVGTKSADLPDSHFLRAIPKWIREQMDR